MDFILLMKSLMVITIYARCVFGRMIRYKQRIMNMKVELIGLVSYRQDIIFCCLVHVKKK